MASAMRHVLGGALAAAVAAAGCAGPQAAGAGGAPTASPGAPAPSPPPGAGTADGDSQGDNPVGRFIVGVGSVVTFPWTLLQRAREAGEMERLKGLDREMEREILDRRGTPTPGEPIPASPEVAQGMRGLILIQDHAAEGGPSPATDPGNGLIILRDHLAPAPPGAAPDPAAADAPPGREGR